MKKIKLDSLNRELQEIWDNFLSHDKSELHPVYFRAVSPSPITFVGMNPSFNEKGLIKTIEQTKFKNLHVGEYFKLANGKFDIDISSQIDELSEEKYSTFFKQHRELAKHLQLNESDWNHIDLFQYRQTNQKEFLGKVLNRDETLNEFGKAQFNVFVKALKLTEPKLIVLANAKVGRIFKSILDPYFSKDIGTYKVKVSGTALPVFLSGMLTGGRALDVFSRERLFWHIEQVFKEQQSFIS